MFNNKDEHESYGLLGISRVTSSKPHSLFGSSIKHSNTIMLRISKASVRRELSNDWYFGEGGLIEVEMSTTQFAEAITSLNVGEGVPVTIRRIDYRGMADPPEVKARERIRGEFKDKTKEIAEQFNSKIEEVKTILQKQSIGKNDREAILKALLTVRDRLTGSLPFIHEQFDEALDKTTMEAKGEIEAFFTHAITNAGRAALSAGEDTPSLPMIAD